jgi:PAS domain S-box-containing protein
MTNDLRKRAEMQREETMERLNLALEAGKMGMWDLDFTDNHVIWNRQLYALLGYDRPIEITPDTFFEHIHEADRPRVRRHLNHTLEKESEFTDEFRIIRKDGEIRWMTAQARVIRDERGQPRRMIGIDYDTTLKHQTEERLQQLVDERTEELRILAAWLARAREEEQQRIAQGLHEEVAQLLAGAQLKISVAEGSKSESECTAHLRQADQYLNRAANHIRNLTFDLSGAGLFEGGLPVAAREMCARMTELHGLRCTLECGREDITVPEHMRAVLYRALRELMYNVVKHAKTDQATVRIETFARTDNEQHRLLRIGVRDNGTGFDPDVLKQPLTCNGGFGLRNLRERIRYIGGRFHIDSIPGDGTEAVIEVKMPCA